MATAAVLRSWCAVLAVASLVAGVARAEPAERVHTGGYYRASAGAASFNVFRSAEQRGPGTDALFAGRESSVHGVVPTFDLSLGAMLASRFTLAGFAHFEWMRDTDIELRDGTRYRLGEPLYFVVVGPEVDVVRTTDGGWHFGLGVGFAALSVRTVEPPFDRLGGVGAGVQLTGGYDWWVAARTGLGFLLGARFAQVGASRQAGPSSVTEVSTVTGFSLSVSLLRH